MNDDEIGESQPKGTLLEWIKGLGLPVASLLVSGAIFVFQSQQQAFERQLSNVEDGYRFYFEHRTSLERHADADQEETLLKLISNTFPNVFCNVRADLHARVASAEAKDAPDGFGEDDRTLLLTMITSRDAPEMRPLSAAFELPNPWAKPQKPEKCAPLDMLRPSVAIAPGSGAATAPITQEPPPADDKKAEEKAEALAPSRELAPSATDPAAASPSVLADAAEGLRAKARAFAQSNDPRVFRVFFHVRRDGDRDPAIFDPLRAPMATNGFRAMRGVEQVAAAPNAAQVRYFGADEAARATELAAMLNQYFASEKLTFKTIAIGDQFPNMPRTTLEVWLPNAATSSGAGSLGLRPQTKVSADILEKRPLAKTPESPKTR
jgi:hypothetical protein